MLDSKDCEFYQVSIFREINKTKAQLNASLTAIGRFRAELVFTRDQFQDSNFKRTEIIQKMMLIKQSCQENNFLRNYSQQVEELLLSYLKTISQCQSQLKEVC